MAARCDNCGKGRDIGHNVSPAKNRTLRLFLPNLQKLKVLKNGVSFRVRFCTSCIQRLKKDGQIGEYTLWKYVPAKTAVVTAVTAPSKKHIEREEKKIEEIMKKEEAKWQEKAKEEKTTAKKKAVEKIRIEELVGKK